MKTIKIPKKDGTFRVVVDPQGSRPFFEAGLKRLTPLAEHIFSSLGLDDIVQAFRRFKSPVTNAKRHILPVSCGGQITINCDLKNYFDSVTLGAVELVDTQFAEKASRYLFEGVARQGLPTSPVIANVAGITIDRAILSAIYSLGIEGGVYTRYADDLTISVPIALSNRVGEIIDMIRAAVASSRFALNESKTRVMDSRHGRINVTGVMIEAGKIHPPRSLRRKIRAARHLISLGDEQAANSLRGLSEAAMLKEPRRVRKTIAVQNAFREGGLIAAIKAARKIVAESEKKG